MVTAVPKFTADQFLDTKYATANVKAKFANQLVKLIAGGFEKAQFTEPVYHALHMHFRHIAEYDRNGFYGVWMSGHPERTKFLLRLVNKCRESRAWWAHGSRSAELWADVAAALLEHEAWLVSAAENEMAEQRAEDEAHDLALYAALKARYATPAEVVPVAVPQPRRVRPAKVSAQSVGQLDLFGSAA